MSDPHQREEGGHDVGTVQFSPGDKYDESLDSLNSSMINFDHSEVMRVSSGFVVYGNWVLKVDLRLIGTSSISMAKTSALVV